MSRSRLEILTSRLGLVSASEAKVSVSGGERLGLVSVSRFYVSCPSLPIKSVADDIVMLVAGYQSGSLYSAVGGPRRPAHLPWASRTKKDFGRRTSQQSFILAGSLL